MNERVCFPENNEIKNSPAAITKVGWFICSMGMLFYTYEFLLRIAPSVMETELRDFFNISATGFGSLVGIYYLVYTPMQLIVGPLVDMFGPRLILTCATMLCAFGSFLFAATPSLTVAGIGRFCMGFGSAFAFVSALKLAANWLPTHRFATFAGLVTALGMVGGMVGDIGLTSLVQHLGWRDTMFAGTVIGLILAPSLALIIRNSPQSNASESARILPEEIGQELLKIIRNPQVWLSGMIACLLYLSLSAFAEVWGIAYLQTLGFSANEAARANSMVFLGWLVGSPVLAGFSDRLRNRRIPLLIGGLCAALSIIPVLYMSITSIKWISVFLFLFGFFCAAEVICFAVAYEKVSSRTAATAVAFVNMLTMSGGFVFQPLIGKFLDMIWSGQMAHGIKIYSIHNYQVALTILPIAMILSVVLSFILREPPRKTIA